jgi:hypothetical protein
MPELPSPSAKRGAKAAQPSREAVAKRAYELYLQRGSVPGYEMEDWLTAEAELTAAAAPPGDREARVAEARDRG